MGLFCKFTGLFLAQTQSNMKLESDNNKNEGATSFPPSKFQLQPTQIHYNYSLLSQTKSTNQLSQISSSVDVSRPHFLFPQTNPKPCRTKSKTVSYRRPALSFLSVGQTFFKTSETRKVETKHDDGSHYITKTKGEASFLSLDRKSVV